MRFRIYFLVALAGLPFFGKSQPATPPILLFPAQGDSVLQYQPVFSWVPMVSSANPPDYYFLLVQVLSGQTPQSAIQANPPFFEMKVDAGTSMVSYPSYAPELIAETHYAWQVSAMRPSTSNDYSGNTRIPSEVYVFQMASTEQMNRCIPQLRKTAGEGYTVVKDGRVQIRLPEGMTMEKDKLWFGVAWGGAPVETFPYAALLEPNKRFYTLRIPIPRRERKKGCRPKALVCVRMNNGEYGYVNLEFEK